MDSTTFAQVRVRDGKLIREKAEIVEAFENVEVGCVSIQTHVTVTQPMVSTKCPSENLFDSAK